MADDTDNDDQWLYGDAPDLSSTDSNKLRDEIEPTAEEKLLEDSDPEQESTTVTENEEIATDIAKHHHNNAGNDQPAPPGADDDDDDDDEELDAAAKRNGDGERSDGKEENSDEDDDDSDDDVNVVIGDIKTSPTYAPLNIKRGGLITTVGDKSKLAQPQTGKFTVDEFEQMGMINGVSAGEFSLDTIEDKPWRKPGADITDYFNYGFNEDTWKAYCERQKRMRVNESGVGMVPLNAIGLPRGQVPIMNDNSKYSGTFTGIRKAGPPPGRRMTGAIDVIGGSAQSGGKLDAPKENVIQVMTADRREYSRKPPGFPDMSMPPPQTFEQFQPEFGFNPEPEPFYGGYEPTQDVQWGTGNAAAAAAAVAWTPTEIKPLTPHLHGPVVPPPAVVPMPPVRTPNISQPPPIAVASVPMPVPLPMPMPPSSDAASSPPPTVSTTPSRTRGDSREREKEREHESRARSEKPRERERDRERERSHRRERSRSRSRRHKSRSRSPTHRSHRKKKSRRHDDSD